MDIATYFNRIKYRRLVVPTIDCLKALHRCHVMSIPFEALDVTYQRKIQLDLESIYKKIVVGNRGGYCYEQNHLFFHILSKIGFECSMVASRIYNDEILGPEFDHMSIVVNLEERWLVDVGYGDLFIEPIKIVTGLIQEDGSKKYQIEILADGSYLLLESLKETGIYEKKYLFDLKPRKIEDYSAQNLAKQHDADSYFVKNRICTLPTENGRETLFNDTYKARRNEEIETRTIEGSADFFYLLESIFEIRIDL